MVNALPPNNGTYLNGLDQAGNPPPTRISTAVQAQQVYRRAWMGYENLRGPLNAKIQGAINGNPPHNQALLDAEGLGWQSNINWRLLEGDVNAAQVPFYMLFADVPQYADVIGQIPKYQDAENQQFSEIVSEKHTKLLKKWRYFDYEIQLGIRNMTTYGSGPLYFTDKRNWQFRAAKQGCIYVPDETTQRMDELPLLFICYEWDVTELYQTAMGRKASAMGWNPAVVKRVLVDACNLQYGWSGTKVRGWEYWQQKIREHDVYWSGLAPKVKTVWGYVREFDRKISRFLITGYQGEETTEFLFRKEREYDSWEQIIHPMFAEIGNGNWNGSFGIGIKAYNFRDAQNRLKNRILDAAFIGSQVLLQAQDDKAAAELQLMQLGPMAIVPPGVTPIQMPMAGTLDKPMMVDRALEVDLQRNIGGIRQNLQDSISSQPISAKEAEINASYSSQLTQAAQAHWYAQLDWLYAEQFRRIAVKPRMESKNNPLSEWEEMLVEFHDECAREGVPPEFFKEKNIKRVCARRSIGRGSEYFKNQIGMQVYQILRSDPNVPQGVVVEHLRNVISNQTGRDYLNQIWPDSAMGQLPTDDASKAQDENGIMMEGIPPILTAKQNNLAHLTTHIPFLASMMQSTLQQQFDPAIYLKTAGVGVPHVQQHLMAMRAQGGKGTQYQELFNAFEQLQAGTKQITQQYQAAQQAKQQEAQKQQAMIAQAHQTGQLLDPKSQVDMARVNADAVIKGKEVSAKIDRDNQLAAAEIIRKNALAKHGIVTDSLLTTQELLQKNQSHVQELEQNAEANNARAVAPGV